MRVSKFRGKIKLTFTPTERRSIDGAIDLAEFVQRNIPDPESASPLKASAAKAAAALSDLGKLLDQRAAELEAAEKAAKESASAGK